MLLNCLGKGRLSGLPVAAVGAICMVACAVRTVTPVAMSQPGDVDLSCSDLTSQVKSNQAKASELLRKHEGVDRANVGKTVVGTVLVPIGLLTIMNGAFAPDHESRCGLVHAVVGGDGADARSINVWWCDPVA